MQANHRITSRWQTWSRKMTGLWYYAVDMSISAVPGDVSAWQTDRWTDRFSALYRWAQHG